MATTFAIRLLLPLLLRPPRAPIMLLRRLQEPGEVDAAKLLQLINVDSLLLFPSPPQHTLIVLRPRALLLVLPQPRMGSCGLSALGIRVVIALAEKTLELGILNVVVTPGG
ncbi:hypothetical protein BGX38DRAFT_1147680 [Terfezia claveryi]|nr:hypothetical protein BGX38DRAFT_1147680 [Terfezia claveryi]